VGSGEKRDGIRPAANNHANNHVGSPSLEMALAKFSPERQLQELRLPRLTVAERPGIGPVGGRERGRRKGEPRQQIVIGKMRELAGEL